MVFMVNRSQLEKCFTLIYHYKACSKLPLAYTGYCSNWDGKIWCLQTDYALSWHLQWHCHSHDYFSDVFYLCHTLGEVVHVSWKPHNYFTAAKKFLSGVTTELTASSNPVMFLSKTSRRSCLVPSTVYSKTSEQRTLWGRASCPL